MLNSLAGAAADDVKKRTAPIDRSRFARERELSAGSD